MIKKMVIAATVIAGLAAAANEAIKHKCNLWQALLTNDETHNLKIMSFKDELAGKIEVRNYQNIDQVLKISGFIWIKEFYEALEYLTVFKKEETSDPKNRFVVRLIKANEEVLEITFGDNELILEDGTIYPVFGMNKLKKLIKGIYE